MGSDTAVKWESQPLECWGKLKELRRQFVTEMWTAKDRLITAKIDICFVLWAI